MNEKSAFEALFDLSFSEFITTRIIKVLYILGIVVSGLTAISWLLAGFRMGFFRGLLSLIVAPLVFLVMVIASRIWCELVMVVFRIAENTTRLVDATKKT